MTVYAHITKCSGGNASHYDWTNGSIRLSTVKNGQTNVITHTSDLEELFPGNEILSDKV